MLNFEFGPVWSGIVKKKKSVQGKRIRLALPEKSVAHSQMS